MPGRSSGRGSRGNATGQSRCRERCVCLRVGRRHGAGVAHHLAATGGAQKAECNQRHDAACARHPLTCRTVEEGFSYWQRSAR